MLGIDISSTSIKMIELSKAGPHYRVEAYARVLLPEQAMECGMVKDMHALVSAIRSLLAVTRFSCKHAILAVSDALTMRKIIQVSDRLSERDIEELVTIEAEKYIPYSMDDINLDFKVLGRSANNSALIDVHIIASRAEHVNDRVEVLRRAGLKTKIVEVESCAIGRVVHVLRPSDASTKTMAILDVGAVFTRFFVLHGQNTIYSREIFFGSNQLAQPLVPCDDRPPYLEPRLLEFRSLLLLHVKQAVQFFYSTTQALAVDHLLFAGGVASQPGLAQFLQSNLNIPTCIVNPFKQMMFAKSVNTECLVRDSTMLMTACGLALRACTKGRVNHDRN